MRLALLIFLTLIGTACQTEQELPIQEDKLIEVLADAHIAEAAVQSLPYLHRDSLVSLYYDQIFKIHNVSRSDFEQSLKMLEYNPDKMLEIYEQVTEHLNRVELEVRQ